jgi:transcriptional regulator of acetoin/glycerol metabolism
MEAMAAYPWPGNVRELRNAVEYAFVLCKGEIIELRHLPRKIAHPSNGDHALTGLSPRPSSQRDELLRALRQVNGNQSEAARLLGVSRVTVWKRIKRYGIDLAADLAAQSS